MAIFQNGKQIPITDGGFCTVEKKLGEGGQGYVYRVNYMNQAFALKWYKPGAVKNGASFYQNLQHNIKKPPQSDAFLWPLYLTEVFEGSFGYLMKLLPDQYISFSKFLLGKVHFAGLKAWLTAALNIVSAFTILHAEGYSYQDLNDGNFSINPVTGNVLLCDNDNVAENGENITGIGGKMRYMAPEIVLGKAAPSLVTDRFSLAIVLFMILCMDHPLDGKHTMVPCVVPEFERIFYGSDPVFIFDPKDDRNRPVRGVHRNSIRLWPCYPQYIQQEFIKAFSKPVMLHPDQNPRTTDRQWMNLLLRARGEIVKCPCGVEHFMNINTETVRCLSCGRSLQRPLVMHTDRYDAMLTVNTKIYPYQVQMDSNDYKNPIGLVIANKKDPSRLGLGNASGRTWKYTAPDGSQADIAPKEVAPLVKGAKINMGTMVVGII